MDYKFILFGDNEAATLKFVDDHWDRIVEFGYTPMNDISGNRTQDEGWFVRYGALATPTYVKSSRKKAESN